jgi:4-hydroxybenzoate polyprenyltransferase
MRPRQWVKNLLLFAGIVFSHNFSHWDLLGRSVAGFILFCLLSGSVYILNDLQDIEADRLHPVKRKRPIASGSVGPALARWFALVGWGLPWCAVSCSPRRLARSRFFTSC